MCAARRTTSARLTRLAAKSSPYHSAVTLYEARDTPGSAEPSTPRRPSRVKQEPTDPETPRARRIERHQARSYSLKDLTAGACQDRRPRLGCVSKVAQEAHERAQSDPAAFGRPAARSGQVGGGTRCDQGDAFARRGASGYDGM